ncbi:MAG: hypothetical protein M0Z41_20305 [Peptococcaceae bacterium]|jgi:hypothetical protein|nr:hypothetical protein [Peptococcaceae bacterium]
MRRLLHIMVALAVVLPVLLFSPPMSIGQTVISGTPTFQSVPNLGQEYGYYWTDPTSGDTFFVVCDQTTGQPVSAYLEGANAVTSYTTETEQPPSYQEMQTLDVYPVYGIEVTVPAANPSTQGGPYSYSATEVLGSYYGGNWGVWYIQNQNPFPVVSNINGDMGVAGGANLTKVTIPANFNGYLYMGGLVDTSFTPSYDDVVSDAVGSNGTLYPVSGNSQFADSNFGSIEMAYLTDYNGYPIGDSGWYDVSSGYVQDQEFYSTTTSPDIGQLENVSYPGTILQPVNIGASSSFSSNIYSTPNVVWGYNGEMSIQEASYYGTPSNTYVPNWGDFYGFAIPTDSYIPGWGQLYTVYDYGTGYYSGEVFVYTPYVESWAWTLSGSCTITNYSQFPISLDSNPVMYFPDSWPQTYNSQYGQWEGLSIGISVDGTIPAYGTQTFTNTETINVPEGGKGGPSTPTTGGYYYVDNVLASGSNESDNNQFVLTAASGSGPGEYIDLMPLPVYYEGFFYTGISPWYAISNDYNTGDPPSSSFTFPVMGSDSPPPNNK